jgi:hypothetical protein
MFVPLMVGFCKLDVMYTEGMNGADDFDSWLAVPDEGYDQF